MGENWQHKLNLYKQLIAKSPLEISFKFHYADCACACNIPVEDFYPILEEGMLMDKTNHHYPTSELFEAIHESDLSFQFDLLLLDKYYQPCSKPDFDEYIMEFLEKYTSEEQMEELNALIWKGE